VILLFDKATAAYNHFERVLEEANYHSHPGSLIDFFRWSSNKLPGTASVAVGTEMISTSQTVGKRFMWAAIFAALSVHTLLMTALVLAAAGAAIMGLEYVRCKKGREDIITEVNFAGQKVTGRRADLCRLHKAQERIMNLGSSFRQASLESTTDTIQDLIASVAGERQRVTVLEEGPFGAMKAAYDFSRPQIALVHSEERADIPLSADVFKSADIFSKGSKPLRENFRKKQDREQEIVAQLAAIHKELSPGARKRFRQLMMAKG
jgi:hypothetical protein